MKICVLFLISVGLLAGVDAGKKHKKCKKDLAAAQANCDARVEEMKQECNVEKETLNEKVADLEEKLLESGAMFQTRACGTSNKVSYDDGKFLINTEGGNWVRDGWCTVLDEEQGSNDNSYTVSADLYADTTKENHLGVAYNVQDINNFDYVYYRPHSSVRCFQSGRVVNGKTTFSVKGACPTQPEFQQWFNVKVEVVAGQNPKFYLNGEFVTDTETMYFPTKAEAGIIMANGSENVGHFKNLEVN